MTLVFDSQSPPRTPQELQALVKAVSEANDVDEAHWLEWKRSVALSDKGRSFSAEARFILAKQILGFANRLPESARTDAHGFGYILIGVQPGEVSGTVMIDHAVLEDALQPYLGSGDQGPKWSSQYIEVEDRNVLVVTVNPPMAGDPIYLLRKTFQGAGAVKGANQGAVFVRRQAKVMIANASDMEGLIRRLQAEPASIAVPEVGVAVSANTPELSVLDDAPESVEAWLEARRRRFLIHYAHTMREREQGHSDSDTLDLALSDGDDRLGDKYVSVFDAFRMLPTKRFDRRTLPQYRREVNDHLEACRGLVSRAAFYKGITSGIFDLDVVVRNKSLKNLRNARLELSILGKVSTVCERDVECWLPDPPAVFHDQPITSLLSQYSGVGALDLAFSMPPPDDTFHENHDGGTTQIHDLGDLRPDETRKRALLPLQPAGSARGQRVDVHWRMTATNVDAVMSGGFVIPVAVDVLALEVALAP